MKNFLSIILALIILSAICSVLLMITGRFEWQEAVIVGVSASVAGTIAPVVVAWVDKRILHRAK